MVASIHYGSMKLLIAARLLVGLACGATTVVLPVYLGELAPPRLRGTFGTFTQLAMVIGILAADLVALVPRLLHYFGVVLHSSSNARLCRVAAAGADAAIRIGGGRADSAHVAGRHGPE